MQYSSRIKQQSCFIGLVAFAAFVSLDVLLFRGIVRVAFVAIVAVVLLVAAVLLVAVASVVALYDLVVFDSLIVSLYGWIAVVYRKCLLVSNILFKLLTESK